jgi:hypothetical protein
MRRALWTAALALTFILCAAVSPADAQDSIGVSVTVPGSPTPTPSPSPSSTSGGQGGGDLPKTGLPIAPMVEFAIALIVVGAGAVVLGRRPRTTRPAGFPALVKGHHL